MPDPKKVISISTARKKVMGQIEVDGAQHDVYQLDFDTNQKLMEADGTASYLGAVRAAVQHLCPTLAEATVGAMGIGDGSVIVVFASGGIRGVEVAFPNAVSPETPTSPG